MSSKKSGRAEPTKDDKKNPFIQHIAEKLKTEKGTMFFLSRMSYIAIVAYLRQRNFIPETILKRRRISADFTYATFNPSTRWGLKLDQQMSGIGEAIYNKYARQVLVMVNENPEDEDQATEVFAVTFIYSEKDFLQLIDGDGNPIAMFSFMGNDVLFEQIVQIVNKISTVTKKLGQFRNEKKTVSLKITYYEHTPSDYQPSFFQHCEHTYHFKDGKPPSHTFGAIKAEHVAAGIELKSVYITDPVMLEEDDSQMEQSLANMHVQMNTTYQSDFFRQDSPIPMIEQARSSPPSNNSVVEIQSEPDDNNDDDDVMVEDDFQRRSSGGQKRTGDSDENDTTSSGKRKSDDDEEEDEEKEKEPSPSPSPSPSPRKRMTRSRTAKQKEPMVTTRARPIEKVQKKSNRRVILEKPTKNKSHTSDIIKTSKSMRKLEESSESSVDA